MIGRFIKLCPKSSVAFNLFILAAGLVKNARAQTAANPTIIPVTNSFIVADGISISTLLKYDSKTAVKMCIRDRYWRVLTERSSGMK